MKKRKLLLLLSVFFLGLTSCNTAKNNDNQNNTPTDTEGGETISTYVLSFDTVGGSTVESQNITQGGKATRPQDPTKAEDENYTYEFAGWYSDQAYTHAFDFNTVITASTTLYAKWNSTAKSVTPATYEITFNTNGGNNISSQTVEEGSKVTRPLDPTREDDDNYTYVFINWYSDSNLTNIYHFETEVYSSFTLYAKWKATPKVAPEPDKFFVTFDTNGGSSVAPVQVVDGGKLDEPTAPTKTATDAETYTFAGWYKDAGFQTAFNFNTDTITEAITLYAKWTATPVEYTVTFVSNGSTNVAKQIVPYGQPATRPENPSRNADVYYTYEFLAWSTSNNSNDNYDFDTPITRSITLYGWWTQSAIHHTVSFDTNGGNQIESQSLMYGDKVQKPADPKKASTATETYTFAGWYKDAGFQTVFNFDTDTITGATTIYAKWNVTPITYAVKYYDGTTLLNTETVTAGDKITYDPPVKSNYTFSGWYTNSSLTEYFDNNTEIFAATTLYAKYTATSAGSINVTSYKGYTEGIHLELDTIPGVSQTGYVVSYKSNDASSYTAIDNELIRINDNVVVDAVGLKAGTYSVKIEANNETLTLSNITVTKDDRSGYAHFNNSNGVGAYNNDGTLKSNAVVVYVTEATKNTVTATFGGKTYTGLANIILNAKKDYPLDVRIIGTIGAATWNQIEYDPTGTYRKNKNLPTENVIGANGVALPHQNLDESTIISSGYNTLNESQYSKLNGLTNKIKAESDGSFDSYYNMLDVKGVENVTIEGIGEDACIFQWGFTWKSDCNSIEVKNITFDDYTEDACSFEGTTDSSTMAGFKGKYYWVHNNTFNSGINYWDVCTEQDKHEGDGATDIKRCAFVTISYNHYYDNHKTGLVGGSDSNLTAAITFHHNFYDRCQSRLPFARQANMHMYNNYYYGSTGNNMQIYAGAYAFIEKCYFENVKNTFIVKENTSGTGTPAVKSYDNIFVGSSSSGATIVTNRTDTVSNDNKFGTTFDTNSSLFYYDSTNKCSNVEIMNSASELPTLLPTVSGAGVFASLVFPNQEQGDDPTPTPTGEFVEVFSDNFSTTTATKYNGIPTTAGLTYYTYLPDNAAETGTPDTYNYVEVKNNSVSIVDTSSKTEGTGDDGKSRTTYAYYMFDEDNQYTSGIVKYSITLNLPVVSSKWKMLTFIDDTYTGTPNAMLGVYSNSDKKLGYSYGTTEQAMFSSAYTTGTYNIELVIDYDNNTAELSINGTSISISNYSPSTIKGFYFMTSAGSQRSYSFSNIKIEKLV